MHQLNKRVCVRALKCLDCQNLEHGPQVTHTQIEAQMSKDGIIMRHTGMRQVLVFAIQIKDPPLQMPMDSLPLLLLRRRCRPSHPLCECESVFTLYLQHG